MGESSLRTLAVDWSGRKKSAAKHIWLAEAVVGELVFLESGRSREEVIHYLIEMGKADPNLVVGIDFAFSMPEWYLKHCGADTVREFWRIAAREGETWLADCDWPFWGRPGKRRHTDYIPLRRTEGFSAGAFSTFQIGGAGAVGTGSLRGMPFLEDLASAGWSIWPFAKSGFPMAIEIYPRLLTGKVRKSCQGCRALYLKERYRNLTKGMSSTAASTDDAFDAAVSALVMDEHEPSLRNLPGTVVDELDKVEGRIWRAPGATWEPFSRCPNHL